LTTGPAALGRAQHASVLRLRPVERGGAKSKLKSSPCATTTALLLLLLSGERPTAIDDDNKQGQTTTNKSQRTEHETMDGHRRPQPPSVAIIDHRTALSWLVITFVLYYCFKQATPPRHLVGWVSCHARCVCVWLCARAAVHHRRLSLKQTGSPGGSRASCFLWPRARRALARRRGRALHTRACLRAAACP
jgi:hypothetical protein